MCFSLLVILHVKEGKSENFSLQMSLLVGLTGSLSIIGCIPSDNSPKHSWLPVLLLYVGRKQLLTLALKLEWLEELNR